MKFKKLFNRIESVRLENVTKKYGDRFAVRDLDLEVRGGELMILIGRSGSGKTTTLRMINRLIEPDIGRVSINGEDVGDFDPVRLRRSIGYVIQNIGLLPHLKVSENIGLILKLEGWDEVKIRERVSELLNFVSLPPESFMDRYPHQLSGGQQQRIGLARALAMDPPLLLMDEPFGALDPLLRTQLQDEFCKIKKELGKTIVFVTHDINEAFKLGDRVAIMDNASLVQVGTPEELIFEPSSELVSEIVDSKRKYRHMEALKVRDMAQPLDPGYFLEGNLPAEIALRKMVDDGLEVAFVFKESGTVGKISLNEVLKAGKTGKSLKEISKSLLVVPADASLFEALMQLKEEEESMALVLEGAIPVGLLFSDRVLQGLI
ncbi:L-proline glycine betaine ABC transport system permease protein ProV [Methanosarcina sp. MTP4]|uniref:ABC transporter ATP-binding protein n=1 Tax=Methanosarcina sp. MTP4 TaxID=1434100 RepID=UPI0006159E50|nr:betaine/proline/choline family ABC transporter ATP-binding protein [Methanosarcina sp. MTP4]AKB25704.1 L-proline glycine betaine ABC transport system permease protein ProV [Methanosarcina sp. MTP4]